MVLKLSPGTQHRCQGLDMQRKHAKGGAGDARGGWRLRDSRSGCPLLAQLRHAKARRQGAQHRQDREEEDAPLQLGNRSSQ